VRELCYCYNIFNLNEEQKKDLLQLYGSAWWSKERTAADVEKILQNTQIHIGIINLMRKLIV
jgi:hypothetical protein